jgi:hypothetical protein
MCPPIQWKIRRALASGFCSPPTASATAARSSGVKTTCGGRSAKNARAALSAGSGLTPASSMAGHQADVANSNVTANFSGFPPATTRCSNDTVRCGISAGATWPSGGSVETRYALVCCR